MRATRWLLLGCVVVAAIPEPASAWEDPEPGDAQARAEAVLHADWNRDKTTSLTSTTTRLRMSMTTLADQRTGLVGVARALEQKDRALDDRLARLGAKVTATEVTIRLAGAILFDFDSDVVRPDAAGTLAEVVEVIQAYAPRPVRIEGHTDSIASEAYNQDLSERRAKAVRAWLEAHGVAAQRLLTRGFGETKPVADNGSAAGRQRNRRVEIVIGKGAT